MIRIEVEDKLEGIGVFTYNIYKFDSFQPTIFLYGEYIVII